MEDRIPKIVCKSWQMKAALIPVLVCDLTLDQCMRICAVDFNI